METNAFMCTVDGQKICGTGFTYTKSSVQEEDIKDVLKRFADMNLFPKSMV